MASSTDAAIASPTTLSLTSSSQAAPGLLSPTGSSTTTPSTILCTSRDYCLVPLPFLVRRGVAPLFTALLYPSASSLQLSGGSTKTPPTDIMMMVLAKLRPLFWTKFRHAKEFTRQAGVLTEKIIHEEVENTKPEQTPLTDNIFDRLKYMQDNQTKSLSVIASLRSELEDASARMKELEFSHVSAANEINGLLQSFREDVTISRQKEHEKIKSALLRLRQEVEAEKSTGRLLKIQNEKLRRELLQAKQATAAAIEELETERKARELTEDVCRELAREIGQDKAEFEQLKREQAEANEKVEIELKMLKMAALWAEDRAKQKLLETQQELEGKHDALEYLKEKLEEFVKTLRKSGMVSLRQTVELLQLEEEEWSGTESPKHQPGSNDPERENHSGGEEMAHGHSFSQHSEEVDRKHEEGSTQEEEESQGSERNYGDDAFIEEGDDPTGREADTIVPNSANSKHELQAPRSQYDNTKGSSMQLSNRPSAPASVQHHLPHPEKIGPGSQHEASKLASSPLPSSIFPKRCLKASCNLPQPRKLKCNSLHAHMLEARKMENQNPAHIVDRSDPSVSG